MKYFVLLLVPAFVHVVHSNDSSGVCHSYPSKPAFLGVTLGRYHEQQPLYNSTLNKSIQSLRGGVTLIPAGYNPLGYKITALGLKFLEIDGCLDSDVGRFLAGMKTGTRKSQSAIKDQWLEIVRVSKQGQSMRIYRTLDELIDFCLKAGFLN